MKIGIITFHRAKNYGALLQCLALYTFLKEKNYNVEIIDYRNPIIENTYRKIPKLRKNLIKFLGSFFYCLVNYKKLTCREDNFEKIRITMKHSMEITKENCSDLNYDVYIAGSDQLWNPLVTKGLDSMYFLDFVKSGVKSTYAMSMGTIENNLFNGPVFNKLVEKFDYISMRESDAAEFMKTKKTKNDVVQSLDPTLLLSSDEWDNLLKKDNIKLPKKYVFVYYVKENSELIKMADKIASEHGLPIVYINVYQRNPVCYKFKSKVYNIVQADPLDFVNCVKNATYVVTSSFHATAFSCIYKKDIFILPHNITGSRVTSIADTFGIQNRIYKSFEDFSKRYKNDKIQFSESEYALLKEKSNSYLDIVCSEKHN